ncbi:MAG TPA: hypothetical protein VML01_03080 [Bryobacterales bacterium]|nr:hypothetical protein [Bryobacterales bacterium]
MTEPSALTIRSMIALSMPLLMGFLATERSNHKNNWTRRPGSPARADRAAANDPSHGAGPSETASRIQWPKARA